MNDLKKQSIPDEGDVAAAAEKLRVARLADQARRGKENAMASGRDDGTGKSPGEGDPVVEKKAPGKPAAEVKEPTPAPKQPPGKHSS